MDPVTSPLIHKDSGHQARVDPGEENPSNLQEQASSERFSRIKMNLMRLDAQLYIDMIARRLNQERCGGGPRSPG